MYVQRFGSFLLFCLPVDRDFRQKVYDRALDGKCPWLRQAWPEDSVVEDEIGRRLLILIAETAQILAAATFRMLLLLHGYRTAEASNGI